MRAHIDDTATLHILPETPEEARLLEFWYRAFTGQTSAPCVVGLEIGREVVGSTALPDGP